MWPDFLKLPEISFRFSMSTALFEVDVSARNMNTGRHVVDFISTELLNCNFDRSVVEITKQVDEL